MVEGPGCKLKGEKIKAKICGQQIRNVSGTAVAQKSGKESTKLKGPCKWMGLIDCRLEEIQVLGKELFMYFGKMCLRIHFLMNGSFRINNKQSDPDGGKQKHQNPVLVLEMTKDSVAFFESSADIRSSDKCRERHESMKTLDICSPVFSYTRALELIKTQTCRLLCDVLLDQSILPGVGNIIKNEALFDSGIKPDAKVKDLKEDHLKHLIRMTRDFSMLFYQCRKTGVSLGKYMKVYGRDKCGQCQGKVVLCRMGQDSHRYTYFCHNCQTNDLKRNIPILPQKNSLLGWLQAGNQSTESEWTCSLCTLINKSSKTICSICITPREQDCTRTDKSFGLIESQNALSPNPPILDENETFKQSSHTNSGPLRFSNSPLSTDSIVQKRKLDTLPVPNSKRQKTSQFKDGEENKPVSGSQSNKEHIPNCPEHQKLCAMREVRKEGVNMRRMFFTCSLPRGKQCKYFKWADEDFPVCPGHGKPCCLRTVLKQGANNGKKFFTCSMAKNKQCDFFQWAEGYG